MNSFNKKLGEYFKEYRLKKNFSLDYVSQETKISKDILTKIEKSDTDFLEHDVYAKGIIKIMLTL